VSFPVPTRSLALTVCASCALVTVCVRPAQAQESTAVSPACYVSSAAPTTIRGTVTDPSSSAIVQASVTFACGSLMRTVSTDAAGTYRLDLAPGVYEVLVERPGFDVGFELLTVEAAQETRHDVMLQVAAVSEAVTVTAGGFEQLVRQAPASVSVVERETLQTRRFGNVAEALADIEGVDVGQDVGKTGGLNISLRGMPSDYTLMLVDGRRQNAAGNVTPNGFTETATSFMPPVGAIERIEVVRGPMSTLYGSDAMGGVVNIITRKVNQRWGGTASVDGTLQGNTDYGNTAQGTAYVAGPVVPGRVGVALRSSAFHREAAALRYETIAGDAVPITSFGLSPTDADVRTLGGRLSVLPHRDHDLYLDIDGAWQRYNNDNRQLGTVGIQGGYQDRLKFERHQLVLAHTARLGFGLVESSLARNTTSTIGRTIPPGTPGRVAGDPRTLDATNTIVDTKLISPVGRHTLSVGGQWWDAHMVDAVAPLPYDHTQGALFAEDEWRLASKVTVTLGLRHDHHSTFGGNTSPRAYVVFTPHQAWTLKGGVSRGFKTPRLEQLAEGITGFGAQGTRPLIGSPRLRPETSTSTEVAAFYTRGIVSANVGVFNNEFQNKIASGPGLENCSFAGAPNRPGCVDYGNWPAVDLFGQSINVDEAVTRGVEAALRLAFLSRWNVATNYTYTHSEQRSGAQAGLPLVNTPRHMVNANVRFAPTDTLNTWLRVEGRSSRTRGTSATALAATAALGDFKPYGLVHLGGGYALTRNVTLNATIYNLLDTDFLAYEPFTLNGQTQYASPYNNLQEPRRFWVSVNVNF
jgi:outer membrane receptor for ferrienterochelin and colicins